MNKAFKTYMLVSCAYTHREKYNMNVKFKEALPHPEYVLSCQRVDFNETKGPVVFLCANTHTHSVTPHYQSPITPGCLYVTNVTMATILCTGFARLAAGRKTLTIASKHYVRVDNASGQRCSGAVSVGSQCGACCTLQS